MAQLQLRIPTAARGKAAPANHRRGPASQDSRFRRVRYLLLLPLLSLLALRDTGGLDIGAQYEHAQQLFVHGFLEKSQQEAELGYQRSLADLSDQASQSNQSDWAWKFRLLEAQAMAWRGMHADAVRVLSALPMPRSDAENLTIQKLALEAISLTRVQQASSANQKLEEAERLCAKDDFPACGEVQRARGVWAWYLGQSSRARESWLKNLEFARSHRDRWLEADATMNIGAASLQQEHYDEAADWSRLAHSMAESIGANELGQRSQGNLGWAYYKLGDSERALEYFLEAEKSATELGDKEFQIKWLNNAGLVYQGNGDLEQASQVYLSALSLAKQINDRQNIVNLLESLTHTSIDAGRLDDAGQYLAQLDPLAQATGNRRDLLEAMYARARIAAALRHDQEAMSGFGTIENDLDCRVSMRLGAEREMARLDEAKGDDGAAGRMYGTSLATFESARAQLKEDSRLPFAAIATRVYDDYIHFLVEHGKADEALSIADQGRARTLTQGLGVAGGHRSISDSGLHPMEIARRQNATLLFYWMGEKQSYLWATTPEKTQLFTLASQHEILPAVERYRKALLGLRDPIEAGNPDGAGLYRALIAPAADLIKPGSTVIVLNDGPLSQLNFETLIVPGATPHYWIEDATLISAPSLSLLASAKASGSSGRKLLLLGDAVSPGPDYPELPMAATEMKRIQQNFPAEDETVFARERANSASYVSSAPQQFAYIHFVAHGVASRTDPLDSAIILSRATAENESFKLHAREIMQHPLHADLVTISACYGSGTRSFAGEGLVGLAWAFLRAGAHNVIGALWEVSDQSTSQLMGELYRGLHEGRAPAVALRQAKLSLLHSQGNFRKPFFWAPLQVYTGL
jgi:CHAT domain-containing protein